MMSQEQDSTKVLFIGNSYTYFWNLPQQVEILGNSQEYLIVTQQSTSGGRNLGNHWKGERKLKSKELLKKGDFDIVVLQNHSMRAINSPDSMLYFGEKFATLAKAHGTKTFIYSTWSREWDPFMLQQISKVDKQLATNTGATLVPVGKAWQLAKQLRPTIAIYDEDGSHPSSLGSYLTACMFYGAITKQSPIGLPSRLQTTDKRGEKLYLNIQSKNNALYCQKVAHQVLLESGLIQE